MAVPEALMCQDGGGSLSKQEFMLILQKLNPDITPEVRLGAPLWAMYPVGAPLWVMYPVGAPLWVMYPVGAPLWVMYPVGAPQCVSLIGMGDCIMMGA